MTKGHKQGEKGAKQGKQLFVDISHVKS